MKDHPIPYTAWSILGLLNCKPGVWPAEPVDPAKPFKFQTRRVANPQPERSRRKRHQWRWVVRRGTQPGGDGHWTQWQHGSHLDMESWLLMRCRYGTPGDRLWAKEGLEAAAGDRRRRGDTRFVWYRADGKPTYRRYENGISHPAWLWKPSVLPSRYMPRWACRIFEVNKRVRLQRVHDISPADAVAEGLAHEGRYYGFDGRIGWEDPVVCFGQMWNSINAKRGHPWESNPWVFAIDHMVREVKGQS